MIRHAASWTKPREQSARRSHRVSTRRNRLNQLCATSTTQRRGGCRSGSAGGGMGRSALAGGGMCDVYHRAVAASRQG